MTATQAADFASRWTVVGTPYNDVVTGVYAVVFQEIATGKKALAIRGTQGATDYLADYFILNGVPPQLNPQYQSLKGKVMAWLGDGTLAPGFTVSGHSLGGYLAAGLVADFSASIDHAYLYNAPGNNSLVTQIMQALGIVPTPDAAKITSLRADEGISPIAELGNDFSSPIPIHIENQFDPSLILSAPLAMNHSQQVLTDSLAVYTLIARIDPAISTGAITGILKASSNGAANSLESALAALGKIFGKTYTTAQTTRDILYDNLNDLQAAITSSGAGALTVTSLADKTASEIASLAKTDIAYRYALNELTPFAVTGNDSLYAAHNSGGELDLYHPASGTGSLTDLYLADRAAMLSWKIQYDSTDHAYTPDWNTDSVSGDWDYIDQGTLIDGAPLQLSIDGEGVTLFTDHQIVFGDSNDNTLTGSGDTDHLYGGAGADTLTGNAGADYLEGGLGIDTYLIDTGDGNDTLLDTDGQGSIIYNGTALTGGTQISTNYWRGANNVTYSLLTTGSSQDLLIDTGAERLTVKDFTSGELGIALPGGTPPPSGQTATGFNIYGDLTPYQMPWDYYLWLAYPTWPYLFDVNGNLVHSTVPMPYFADKIFDSAGDDNIYAGHGLNVIYATKGGNNYIESGANDDYIVGGSGRDVVFSGGMSDTIDVAGGNDIVYGADGGDVVEGGAGDDYLVGGSGADALNGGDGNDQVYGSDPMAWQEAVAEDDSGVSGQGELLAGGGGNDLVVGSQTNDALLGGAGQDQLAGRAGDDILLGDSGLDFAVPPLSAFDMIIGTTNWPIGTYNNFHSPYTTAPMLNLQFQRIDHGANDHEWRNIA